MTRASTGAAAVPGAGEAQAPAALTADLLERFEGRQAGSEVVAPDPVNQPMIRHWVEAMGDENSVYVDEQAARAAGFSSVIAPASMLQAWTMRGYRRSMEIDRARATGSSSGPSGDALEELFGALDAAGFTSVVATDCEQEYLRPLVVGDLLHARSVIETVSAEKRTALGPGHFVTTRTDYADDEGRPVATMRFRVLRFRPVRREPATPSAPRSGPGHERVERPARPRPAITEDNAFFFDGAKQGKLLVQRCGSCGRLRHPPGPSCSSCRSLEWEPYELSGRGTLYSYVVVHHPHVPAFDYPLVIGLAQLEEGTRLVADVTGADPADVRIGMPLVTDFVAFDPDLTLPVFRPAHASGAAS